MGKYAKYLGLGNLWRGNGPECMVWKLGLSNAHSLTGRIKGMGVLTSLAAIVGVNRDVAGGRTSRPPSARVTSGSSRCPLLTDACPAGLPPRQSFLLTFDPFPGWAPDAVVSSASCQQPLTLWCAGPRESPRSAGATMLPPQTRLAPLETTGSPYGCQSEFHAKWAHRHERVQPIRVHQHKKNLLTTSFPGIEKKWKIFTRNSFSFFKNRKNFIYF